MRMRGRRPQCAQLAHHPAFGGVEGAAAVLGAKRVEHHKITLLPVMLIDVIGVRLMREKLVQQIIAFIGGHARDAPGVGAVYI